MLSLSPKFCINLQRGVIPPPPVMEAQSVPPPSFGDASSHWVLCKAGLLSHFIAQGLCCSQNSC